MNRRPQTRWMGELRRTTPLAARAAIAVVIGLWALATRSAGAGADSAIPKAPVPRSPYMAVVYRYADALVDKGRDTYGTEKTGLFLSALEPMTLVPLTNRPAAPQGVNENSRVGAAQGPLVGANLQHDENLLRLLYFLSDLTTKPKYRDAADGAIRSFFTICGKAGQDYEPWGQQGFWDVFSDRPVATTSAGPTRPWVLWDRAFAVAPEASLRVVLRHRAVLSGLQEISDRQAGFQLRSWAAAYAHTKDESFLKDLEMLIARSLRKSGRAGDGRMDEGSGDSGAAVAKLALAIDCDGASRQVPERLASPLRHFADWVDEMFCALNRDLKPPGGFLASFNQARIEPTSLWRTRPGAFTTAQVGMMCVSRYDNTGKVPYRKLIFAAADAYRNSSPTEVDDAWPLVLGQAISLELAAWRHSANPAYLERARELGDLALDKYFGTNALPRASGRTDHYESLTGADTLALALAELHLHVLHITAVRCPPNTIDR